MDPSIISGSRSDTPALSPSSGTDSSNSSSSASSSPTLTTLPHHFRLDISSAGFLIPKPTYTPPNLGTEKKKSHAKKKPVDHVPRPRNAFILFRCDVSKQGVFEAAGRMGMTGRIHAPASKGTGGEKYVIDHREISRFTAALWKTLTPAEKQPWLAMAEREKQLHQAANPGYRYVTGSESAGATAAGTTGDIPQKTDGGLLGRDDVADWETQAEVTSTSTAVGFFGAWNGFAPDRPNSCPPGKAHTPLWVSDGPQLGYGASIMTRDDLTGFRRPSRATFYTTEPDEYERLMEDRFDHEGRKVFTQPRLFGYGAADKHSKIQKTPYAYRYGDVALADWGSDSDTCDADGASDSSDTNPVSWGAWQEMGGDESALRKVHKISADARALLPPLPQGPSPFDQGFDFAGAADLSAEYEKLFSQYIAMPKDFDMESADSLSDESRSRWASPEFNPAFMSKGSLHGFPSNDGPWEGIFAGRKDSLGTMAQDIGGALPEL